MVSGGAEPRWLSRLERRLGWLAVPNIGVIIVTLQGLGFLMVMADPIWVARLALLPDAVLKGGEYWRLITFLSLPLASGPLWVLFALWFLYFVIGLVESEWGAFKTTLYVLISWLVTIVYSLATGYPVLDVSKFESSLFLAAAALFPETTVSLFFALPVKIKWLAWFTLALLAWEQLHADWRERFFTLAILSNYLVFFGPSLLGQLRQRLRRARFQRELRR